jgi:hypothetical protein
MQTKARRAAQPRRRGSNEKRSGLPAPVPSAPGAAASRFAMRGHIMANSTNTPRPLARCAQGRLGPFGPEHSVPGAVTLWVAAASLVSTEAQARSGTSTVAGGFATRSGAKGASLASPGVPAAPAFVFQSNHHLNKPRLQAARPKAAPFWSFPPTSAPSWRPARGGLRGICDVRLGKCSNVRASSERRADPTVLPPHGAPVLRASADTSVGGRAREEMRNSW